jgi:hypothetical protein
MPDAEGAAGMGEAVSVEAGAVVGHHAPHLDAEPMEVGDGLAEETAGGDGFFVGQHRPVQALR